MDENKLGAKILLWIASGVVVIVAGVVVIAVLATYMPKIDPGIIGVTTLIIFYAVVTFGKHRMFR